MGLGVSVSQRPIRRAAAERERERERGGGQTCSVDLELRLEHRGQQGALL